MFTGEPPEKLGLLNLLVRDGYGTTPVCSTDIIYPTIWDRATEAGLRSILCGVPITWPPRWMLGVTIGGYMSPPGVTNAFPPKLADEVEKRFGPFRNYLSDTATRPKAIVQDAIEWVDYVSDVCVYLMRTRQWELLVTVFTAIDHAQHQLWTRYPQGVRQVYEAVDIAIGRILREAPDPKNVLIVSDHGFRTHKENFFYVNRWLHDQGMLDAKRKSILINWETIRYILQRMGVGDWTRRVPPRLAHKIPDKAYEVYPENSTVFLDETTKFTRVVGFRINLEGREPHGKVSQDEYDACRRDLISRLSKLGIFSKIVMKEEFFDARVAPHMPDVLAFLEPGIISQTGMQPRWRLTTRRTYGGHGMYGIFIGKGPDIEFAPPRVQRVYPLLMRCLGLKK
jgi:predicted AlkP superfamily phosphohydrolase/phosphomutase